MTIKENPHQPTAMDAADQAERGEAEIVVPPEERKPPPSAPLADPDPDFVVKPSITAASTLDSEATAGAAATTTHGNNLEEASFPNAFYCPITKKIMEDPVVHPNGDSYEKTAAMESNKTMGLATLYHNRALKAYIECELERYEDAGSVRGTLRKLDSSLRSGWDKFVDKTGVPLGEFRPLPDGKNKRERTFC